MIYFVIPVYNERANLERLAAETASCMSSLGFDFKIIFVNDGSSDGSLELMEELSLKYPKKIVIKSHYPNKGVRRTFMEGFEAFLSLAVPGDILITKEADNTSDNSIVSQMIESVSNSAADISLASCYAPGGGLESTTFSRMLMSKCANTLVKLRFNLWRIHTLSSFYRAFRYECIADALARDPAIMTAEGFTCVVEMLIKLKNMNFRIVEIPMLLRSSQRLGKSKIPVLRTIIGYLKLVCRKI